MSKVRQLHEFLWKASTPRFIGLMVFIGYAFNFASINFIYFFTKVNPVSSWGNVSDNIGAFSFISSTIISPYIETLVFQAFVIEILCKKVYNNKTKMLLSAACFGLLHLVYSPFYSISAFVVGIIFAYSYILYKKKEQNPILVVTIIHGSINAISLIVSQLIK